jgi:PIN domain nuclease of toxin-antitoxin system
MGLISYLDTNVVIALHSGNTSRLTHRATEQIENTDLLVSAMVLLELEMLYEKGAILYRASQILSDLSQQIGLSVCQLPFASIVQAATEQVAWTREPGDRLIVANAIANNQTPLVTSDRNIHANYNNAIW